MVNYCAVYGCKNSSRLKNFRFFSFPYGRGICMERLERATERRRKWFHFLKRADIKFDQLKTRVICSAHFLSGHPAKADQYDSIDYIPSMKAPSVEDDESVKRRYKRLLQRSSSSVAESNLDGTTTVDDEENSASDDTENCAQCGREVQADITLIRLKELEQQVMEQAKLITKLNEQVSNLTSERKELSLGKKRKNNT